jgi:hypothetical protein
MLGTAGDAMTEIAVGTFGWFIDKVLLGDLKRMIVDCQLHYLGFGNVASGIEFLGACIDNYPMGKKNVSQKRFNNAVRILFDARYALYVDAAPDYDLYTNLRCGMAHIIRPQGNLVFTTRTESEKDHTTHLEMIPGTNKLVLISEDLYADFTEAALRLRVQMANGEHPKHASDLYLAITEP